MNWYVRKKENKEIGPKDRRDKLQLYSLATPNVSKTDTKL